MLPAAITNRRRFPIGNEVGDREIERERVPEVAAIVCTERGAREGERRERRGER